MGRQRRAPPGFARGGGGDGGGGARHPGSSGAPSHPGSSGGEGVGRAGAGGWSPGEGGWRRNPHAKENLLQFHCDMTGGRLEQALKGGLLGDFTDLVDQTHADSCLAQLRQQAAERQLKLTLRFQRAGPGGQNLVTLRTEKAEMLEQKVLRDLNIFL